MQPDAIIMVTQVCTAIESEAGSPGDSYIDGVVIPAPPPPVPEPEPAVPTFEELVAQASSFEELKALVAAKIA
jgi:hypothetical protein